MTFTNYIWVIIGGGIGSAARYWLSGYISRWSGSVFPWGTLVVNIIGCLVIGIFMSVFHERFVETPQLRLLLTIGICGGFTTFSTFSYETIMLLQSSEYFYATMYIGGSLVLCLVGTWLGLTLGKVL